ncbi:hypothetical protein E3O44_00295 [Cryobacterium algoricola]|uniref:Glycosyltransferase RgtA/B/C/D-like domain-containing protein n=1 Tax=Cryobacterium algoricola TaxID=1259183 RepID=A0ABY2IHU8_9MICO|nr:hypothetical protein [Cryobacterium algoricola]TFB91271.1 hypothetical protein E3O44_00295 [Cryobacterium algoricola]
MYWNGAHALLTGGGITESGGLALRGIFSAVIYVPAAFVALVAGEGSAGWAVLVQNAALISVIGGIIVPRLAGRGVQPRSWQVWVSAIGTSLLLRGFAPFTLLDLWAVAFVLVAVLLLSTSTRALMFVLGGCALAVGVNLRPVYIVPVALLFVIWCVPRWKRAVFALVGICAGFSVQAFYNGHAFLSWLPWPVDTFRIGQIQTQYASFIVRYDTLAYDGSGDPRQFSCSPSMADLVSGRPPGSVGELIQLFVAHPIQSTGFAVEKVASSLNWSAATPYSGVMPGRLTLFGVVVVFIAIAGLLVFLRQPRVPGGLAANLSTPLLLTLSAATAGTIVFSAPEARFALPIVLVGMVGLVRGLGGVSQFMNATARGWIWRAVGVLLIAGFIVLGQMGLAHPAPRGDVTSSQCVEPPSASGAGH